MKGLERFPKFTLIFFFFHDCDFKRIISVIVI